MAIKKPTDAQDAEIAHDPETGEIPDVEVVDADEPGALDLEISTLSGDLRDAFLTRFRIMQKPWPQMSEVEQRDFSNGIDAACREAVRQAVRIVTNYEYPSVVVTLGEVKIKGEKGIEAKITAPNISEYRETLGDHVGSMITCVMVDSADFLGERAEVAITPDQPDLPISDEVEIDNPDAPDDVETPAEPADETAV